MENKIEIEKKPAATDADSGTDYLDPALLAFTSAGEHESVKLEIKGPLPRTFARIRALPAFPFSAPGRMIQIYEVKEDGMTGKMIGVLERLDVIELKAAAMLERIIRQTRLLPEITRIDNLLDEWHAFHWFVTTDRGAHDFFTGAPNESIQYASGHRMVVEDLAGNHYVIADRTALDAHSREMLERAT